MNAAWIPNHDALLDDPRLRQEELDEREDEELDGLEEDVADDGYGD